MSDLLDDLIERLRWSGQDAMTKHLSLGMATLHAEAAGEITRLRAELEAAQAETERLRELLKHADDVTIWEHNMQVRQGFQEEIEAAVGISGATIGTGEEKCDKSPLRSKWI